MRVSEVARHPPDGSPPHCRARRGASSLEMGVLGNASHAFGFVVGAALVVRALREQLAARARRRRRREIRRVPPGTRVCIYGLSANPPTDVGGHGTIVRHLRKLFDEVWILPVYRHAFDSKASSLAPYEFRRRMCQLAFRDSRRPARRDRVKVLDIEKIVVEAALDRARARGLPLDSVKVGSRAVLARVRARNPGVDFAWCLGGDTYADLREGKWRDHEAFQRECAQVVVPRVGGIDALPELGPNARVLELGDVSEEVSSTTTREMLAARGEWRRRRGAGDDDEWDGGEEFDPEVLEESLRPEVLEYIESRGLYGA